MDLSSLSGLLGGSVPSLLDYMDGGKMSGTASNSTALQILNNGLTSDDSDSSSSDSINLSPEAQQILAQIQGTSSSGSTTTDGSGVTKAAQNFIGNFFTASGIDTTKLSDQAQQLLQGFQDLVGTSGATSRDTTTDTAEAQYNNGNRQVYTLVGDGRRIRIAVDYTDGKPASMTLTDITSDGQVTSAKVTVTPATDTTGQGLDVAETQYKYSSGILTDTETKPVMSMDLYAPTAATT